MGTPARGVPAAARPSPPSEPRIAPAAPARARRWNLWWTCGLSGLVAFLLGLPAIWWGPVNIDEEVTARIAPLPLGRVVGVVWGTRGGGPAHFLLEHFALLWPGGLVGLRLPSLLLFLAALPAAALFARELAGEEEAHLTVTLVAVAPLAVAYSTFGRPHMLLLAGFLWAAWLALRAARLGGWARWGVAGALLGSLVYVHPTAPLYTWVALGAAVVHSRLPWRRLVAGAVVAVVSTALVSLPYYLQALGVLRQRYDVGDAAPPGRTFTGNSVLHDAVHALVAAESLVNAFTLLAAVGFVSLLLRSPRSAVALAAMIVAPYVFFMQVQTGYRSGLFFARYMLPALPAFGVLCAAGCLAFGRIFRHRIVAAVLALAVLVALDLRADVFRLVKLHALELPRVERAVAAQRRGTVLFTASGDFAPQGSLDALTYSRPAWLLSRYLSLQVDGLRVASDATCADATRFRVTGKAARGLWLFYATEPVRRDPFSAVRGVAMRRIAASYLLVTSRRTLPPSRLLDLGARLRLAWARAVPADRRALWFEEADTCGRARG